MKKHFTFYSLLFVLVLIVSSWQYQKHRLIVEKTGFFGYQLRQYILNDVEVLHQKLKSWQQEPANFDLYKKARKALKNTETFWEFIDGEQYNTKINAAPLLKPEKGVIDFAILQPQGFQVVDELFAEEIKDTAQIKKNINNLIKQTNLYQVTLNRSNISQRTFLEAIYTSVNRMYNFGLSNFDTPGTTSELEDAKTLLIYWEESFSQFLYPMLVKNELFEDKKVVQNLLKDLNNQINKKDLDYLYILRENILPLQATLKNIQLKLGVEFKEETTSRVQPINGQAKHFFDPEFLNPNYFSGVHKKEYSKDLSALGKLLFNDPVLSRNNKRACASCHDSKKAFADGEKTSIRFDEKGNIKRNSPGLINGIFAEKYFLDLRAADLIAQIDHVVNNPHEFNTDFPTIIKKLSTSKEYKDLFAQVFPNHQEKINKYSISKALNAYLHDLVSFQSPFDKYIRKESNDISDEAKQGFNLFMGKAQCATCHFAPLYSGLVPPFYTESESEVLGVWEKSDTINPQLDDDLGRIAGGVIRETFPFYERSFKTTTLRNINETAPYMHNGAFKTLEEVLHFYNQGGGKGKGLEIDGQTLSEDHLFLTEEEMINIIAFLKELSDNPFQEKSTNDWSLPKFPNKKLNNRVYGGVY
jgi:cytochrome c peroxidase